MFVVKEINFLHLFVRGDNSRIVKCIDKVDILIDLSC